MKTRLILLTTFLFSLVASGQKMDGVYEGLIEMCHTDSMGVKICFGDELESNNKWFHLSYLKLQDDSVFLDMHPISVTEHGDTLYSASDGGFYFYKGTFSSSTELKMELVEVYCDYCPQEIQMIKENDYRPIQSELKLTGEISDAGLHINGQLFTQIDNHKHMESQHYKPDK